MYMYSTRYTSLSVSIVDQYPKVPELWDHRRYVLKRIAALTGSKPFRSN